eukprot:m.44188 g.44188  ORF g.44188 m.44188 type:complete len:205 (-) comp19603_c1_seq1:79-693(-)
MNQCKGCSDATSNHICGAAVGSAFAQNLGDMDWERGIWGQAKAGNIVRVTELASKGSNVVNGLDNSGFSALHYASRANKLDVVKLLLLKSAHVDARAGSIKSTSLQRAAMCGHIEMVTLLLSHSADPMLQDVDGRTALHKAVEGGRPPIARLLLTKFPSLATVVDKNGECAEDFALKYQSKNVKQWQKLFQQHKSLHDEQRDTR